MFSLCSVQKTQSRVSLICYRETHGSRTAWTELRRNFAEMRSGLSEQSFSRHYASRPSRRPEETRVCVTCVLIDADRENGIEAYQHCNSRCGRESPFVAPRLFFRAIVLLRVRDDFDQIIYRMKCLKLNSVVSVMVARKSYLCQR